MRADVVSSFRVFHRLARFLSPENSSLEGYINGILRLQARMTPFFCSIMKAPPHPELFRKSDFPVRSLQTRREPPHVAPRAAQASRLCDLRYRRARLQHRCWVFCAENRVRLFTPANRR